MTSIIRFFLFIPNTAEVAFYGMLQGLDDYLNEEKVQQIAALGHHPDMEELEVILSRRIRSEKVAIKGYQTPYVYCRRKQS